MQENTAQGNENVRRRADCGGKPVRANAEDFRPMKKTGGRADDSWLEGTGRGTDGRSINSLLLLYGGILRAAGHLARFRTQKREKENPSLFFIRL